MYIKLNEMRLKYLWCESKIFLVFWPQDLYDFFFFKQKTAYEIGTGDWSSDVCSSDLSIQGFRLFHISIGLVFTFEYYDIENDIFDLVNYIDRKSVV